MGLSTKKSGEDLCTQLYPYVSLAPNAWGVLDPSPPSHKLVLLDSPLLPLVSSSWLVALCAEAKIKIRWS